MMFKIRENWENFKSRMKEKQNAAWMNFKSKLPEKT